MTEMTREGTVTSVGAGDTPSDVIIETVAAATGIDPLELPPLQAAVDVEAMDRLFETSQIDELRFTYQRYEVCVTATEVRLMERQ